MDKIDVFMQANVPQHLAVRGERPDLPDDKQARSCCGKPTAGMSVQNVSMPVTLTCTDCQWQLDQWLKRANNDPDYDD
jgi:hypothetical protein